MDAYGRATSSLHHFIADVSEEVPCYHKIIPCSVGQGILSQAIESVGQLEAESAEGGRNSGNSLLISLLAGNLKSRRVRSRLPAPPSLECTSQFSRWVRSSLVSRCSALPSGRTGVRQKRKSRLTLWGVTAWHVRSVSNQTPSFARAASALQQCDRSRQTRALHPRASCGPYHRSVRERL